MRLTESRMRQIVRAETRRLMREQSESVSDVVEALENLLEFELPEALKYQQDPEEAYVEAQDMIDSTLEEIREMLFMHVEGMIKDAQVDYAEEIRSRTEER